MKEEDRVEFICFLLYALKKKNNWGGMTHLQKGCYIAQKMLGVPLGYTFIQYTYGPYAFKLKEVISMITKKFILRQSYPMEGYGISFDLYGDIEKYIKEKKNGYKYKKEIDFIAGWFLDKPVGKLEKLAAAHMMIKQHPNASLEKRIEKLREWKPFMTEDQAKESFDEVEKKTKEAEKKNLIKNKQ